MYKSVLVLGVHIVPRSAAPGVPTGSESVTHEVQFFALPGQAWMADHGSIDLERIWYSYVFVWLVVPYFLAVGRSRPTMCRVQSRRSDGPGWYNAHGARQVH